MVIPFIHTFPEKAALLPTALSSITPPLPVTVHVADNGRWFPYSSGNLNCFSALAKWLEVTAITLSAQPPATSIEPSDIPSPIVEQAPNKPKYGILYLARPKDEAISCPNKSPERM